MTESLSMPKGMFQTPPGETAADPYTFDHIPGLRELLPKHRGLPGFQYLQCSVVNLRRAQSEGWYSVQGSVYYRLIGPKGFADMSLMVRGKKMPGQAPDSGARLCFCDTSVQETTGLWINPNQHQDTEGQTAGNTVKSEQAPTPEPVPPIVEPQVEGKPIVFRSGSAP